MNKVVGVLVVLVAAGCIVAGLGVLGMIKLPGIKPPSTKNSSGKVTATPPPVPADGSDVGAKGSADKADPAAAKATQLPKTLAAANPDTTIDPVKGARTLAGVWDEMETKDLVPILSTWRDADLAKVFLKMDPDKVAEVLSQLKSDRASKISQAMQKQASIVPAA